MLEFKRLFGLFSAIKPLATLIILDDIFPHLLSAPRIAEYNTYLERFSDAKVYSTASAFSLIQETRSFSRVRDEYEQCYPHLKGRAFEFSPDIAIDHKLVYTIFINNIFSFIDMVDKSSAPFVFTLYPGGGFHINQSTSDNKLRRVFSSPNFRKVIATQKITYEYLIENQFCEPDQVKFIYGGVLPLERLQKSVVPKKYYQQDKDTFDICFVAYKYMEKGSDKGYDVFIEVVRLLAKMHKNIRFHVIGSFDESDIEVSDIKDKIRFYGKQRTDFFVSFYASMDIILSPNTPFVLMPGSFDGFPTGACAEAGLCGVAVFCTDILNSNIAFKENDEIVIISRNPDEICDLVNQYYQNPDNLYTLAKRGQKAFERTLSFQAQMEPRLQILSECLEKI